MRILLIAKNINNKGGAGRYALSLANELAARNLNFSILTEPSETLVKNERDILKPLFGASAMVIFYNFIGNIFRTRRVAADFEVIHALDGWPYGVYGYFAVIGTRKKLFITGVGTYAVSPMKNLAKGFLLRRSYMRASQIFAISEFTKQKILKYVRQAHINTVFLGTTRLPELSEEKINEYKKEYKIKNQFPILLTVGDIKERKGQLDTLKAANMLKNEYPDFKYIMIGSDREKYYVDSIWKFVRENKLESNVVIVSDLYDDSALSFFYQVCDVFLLNSNNDSDHFEGFGLALLEAAQFGKPVIGSRNCGIESAMEDGYNGYLTEQKDTRMIYGAILRALKEKDRLGENSRKFYKKFSWTGTASEYLRFYRK